MALKDLFRRPLPTPSANALDFQRRVMDMQIQADMGRSARADAYHHRMNNDPVFAAEETRRSELETDIERKADMAKKIAVHNAASLAVVKEHMQLLQIYSTEALAAVLARDEKLRTHLALALTLAPAFTPEETR